MSDDKKVAAQEKPPIWRRRRPRLSALLAAIPIWCILDFLIKLIYGLLFGLLVWSVLVAPYLQYYDFTRGSGWPAGVFSLSVAMVFLVSRWSRSLMVLFLPSLLGGATQNYIIVLIVTALVAHPVSNMGLNAVESVRVIGCSLTLTFDQLRERAKLVLNPVLEVLSERREADLDPLRRSLFEIQQYVGQLGANINATMLETISLHSSQQFAAGRRSRAGRVVALATGPGLGGGGDAVGKHHALPGHVPGAAASANAAATAATAAADGAINFEWDLETFGVKASVDMEQLRALAKRGRLRQLLERTNATLAQAAQHVNVVEILYEGCLAMFREAKGRCAETVADMQASCKATIGPLLATWWCTPVTYSLDKICPWLLNQLVNETSVCSQMRVLETGNVQVRARHFTVEGLEGSNSTRSFANVSQAFGELTRQIAQLNGNLLELQQAADDDDDGKQQQQGQQQQQQQPQLKRFELALSFNERTRQVFQDTRQLIEFIRDKYKLRKLALDLLLLAYDLYTSYTFALILLDAWRYRRDYLSDIKFDNCYITTSFRELDDEKRASSRRVLPLTRDEAQQYISTFTCRRRTREERHLVRASCTTAGMLLALAASLLYLDHILYSILASIEEHSLVRFHETGHHEVEVRVRGEGLMAKLVRRLTQGLQSAYKLNRLTSTQPCLPEARATPAAFYWHLVGLCATYFIIDQVAIYARRLRRVTCAFFYPHKERARLEYLHKFIRFQRRQLALVGLKSYLDDPDDEGPEESQGHGEEEEDNESVLGPLMAFWPWWPAVQGGGGPQRRA